MKVASSIDIGVALNLSHKWVGQKITLLRRAGRIYISGHRRSSITGTAKELYSLRTSDMEEDEPRLPPQTGAERAKAYHRRQSLLNKLLGKTNDTAPK